MTSSTIFTGNASGAATSQNRNVYVASLPLNFDDQQLHNLFSPFGRIISARIMRAKKSHLSKGYGFVMFREASGAEQAIQALHGRVIGGSRIQVRWASADASTTFSKVSHAPASANNSTSTQQTATNAATANTMIPYVSAQPNAQFLAAATNVYPASVASPAFTFLTPAMQYDPQPAAQTGAAIALHQNYGALLNSPVLSATQNGMAPAGFAAQSPPQQVLQQLTSTPPQHPMYVMVLPNGEHHIVQLNQLSFPNM